MNTTETITQNMHSAGRELPPLQERLKQLQEELRWMEGSKPSLWADRLLTKIDELLPELKILQSNIYGLFQDDTQRQYLQHLAGFALTKEPRRSYQIGEGIIGQTASSQRITRYTLTTDLGPQTSFFRLAGRTLCIEPLKHNEQVLGVWEFLTRWEKKDIPQELLTKVHALVGQALSGYLNQYRIEHLLRIANRNNNKLVAKEKTLKQKVNELNRAQGELQDLQAKLEEANENLEEKVKERTAELEAAMDNLQDTQQQLIVAEKMASLGQLIAGVAHEINTPIGAVKAASNNIMDLLPGIMQQSTDLLAELSKADRKEVASIVNYFLTNEHILSSKEERKLKREYRKELEARDVADADYIVDSLVSSGFYLSPAPFTKLLTGEKGHEILAYLTGQGQMIRNLRNIELAANKTSKVVYALKSFSHTHEANELTPVDLTESLDTVLVLYHNMLKRGIDVTTALEELPPIMGNPDELSQVWTNIIQNAAQAMDHSGKLHIELLKSGSMAEVRITDNGKGIPEDIQQRIFEPFFTTKKRGEGTGLGLDICRKIVERHQGTIAVESKPGKTTFIIRLPLAS